MGTRVVISIASIAMVAAVVWIALRRSSNLAEHTPVAPAPAVASAADEPEPELSPSTERERTPAAQPVVVESSTTTADEFALVRILVVDKTTNAPLAHVWVNAEFERDDPPRPQGIRGARGKPFDTITTGADGRVEIEAPPGMKLEVRAHIPNRDIGTAELTLAALERGKTYDVTLALPSGFDMPFWLRVVDESSRAPIAGALIGNRAEGIVLPPADSIEKAAATKPAAQETDADGLMLLDARTWRTSTFEVTARGYGTGMIVAERGHATAELAYVLELRRGGQVSVRVLDKLRAPLPQTRIALSCAAYELGRRDSSTSSALIMSGPRKPTWKGTTDADGRFTFTDLPAHVSLEGEVSSTPAWTAPELEPLEAGEARSVEWVVGLVHTVRGLVLDTAGTPLPHCEIWLKKADHRRGPQYFQRDGARWRKTKTDVDGRFVLDGVESGPWWIGPGRVQFDAQTAAATPAPLGQFVELTDAMADTEVEMRVDRGLFIRGNVVDAEGRPADEARVFARFSTSRVYFGELTEADGSFTLGPLMAGTYQIFANKKSGEESVEKVVAQSGDSGLSLRLTASCSVTGRVLDETGAGVSCTVWITSPGDVRKFFMGSTTKSDGSFDLSGVNPGAVQLYAATVDGRFGSLALPANAQKSDTSDVVLRVSPAGRVRVRHKGPERYPSLTLMHGADVVGFTNLERDAFEEFVVPMGPLSVRLGLEIDERFAVRHVVAKPGEVAEVVFEKDPR